MTFGTKTNERPGTRAQVRYLRVSAYKAREVLDLIRGLHVDDADGVLEFTDRAVATDIRKVLASAVANAEKNDEIDPNELYVSACYADEGPTLKRWRPRARGRATRIRKRTCHITIIVSRMDPKKLEQRQARTEAAVGRGGVRRDAAEARRARVAKSQAARAAREHDHDHDHEGPHTHDEDGNAIPLEDRDVDEDLTDEVMEQAEADNPAEPEEAVEAAVEEAAEEAQTSRRGCRGCAGASRSSGDADEDPRARSRRRATTEEKQLDGSEGQPLRVPARGHHRVEVALVRRPQGVRRLRHRGLEDPQLPHDAAAARRDQPRRDRAHP